MELFCKTGVVAMWCEQISLHAMGVDSIHWKYSLTPHDQLSDQMTSLGKQQNRSTSRDRTEEWSEV